MKISYYIILLSLSAILIACTKKEEPTGCSVPHALNYNSELMQWQDPGIYCECCLFQVAYHVMGLDQDIHIKYQVNQYEVHDTINASDWKFHYVASTSDKMILSIYDPASLSDTLRINMWLWYNGIWEICRTYEVNNKTQVPGFPEDQTPYTGFLGCAH